MPVMMYTCGFFLNMANYEYSETVVQKKNVKHCIVQMYMFSILINRTLNNLSFYTQGYYHTETGTE